MIPGPRIIRKCSACGKLIVQHTLCSGNTFKARWWTDGKRKAPMLPDYPWLVKCHYCEALIWIKEQQKVGEIEFREPVEDKFKDALPYNDPSFKDYIAILAREVFNNRKERYLRVQAWWMGNDQRREGDNDSPFSKEETANLHAFALLLNEFNENDRLMKAEVMRELGKYQEALAILSSPFSDELVRAVSMIRDLASQNISFVREMKFR